MTAARVRKAIESLNYRPDLQAGDLRRGERKSKTVGLMVGATFNPFSVALQWAVERVALENDSLVLSSSLDGDPAHERRAIEALLSRRLDGLIIATATRSHSFLRWEQERGMPVVFADGMPLGVEADAVLSDHRAAAAVATRHLIGQGHHRIAYFGARRDVFTIGERRQGVIDELLRVGIEPDSATFVDDLDEESAQKALLGRMELPHPPTAIVGGQNLATRGVIRGLHQLGKHHEVALVSIDDNDLFDLLDPAITVVAQDAQAIGAIAAQRVFDRLSGDNRPMERFIVATRLVERGSGEITPARTSPAPRPLHGSAGSDRDDT